MNRPRYEVTFEAAPGGPPESWLRRLLKLAWRALGLRCVRCVEIRAELPKEDSGREPPAAPDVR